MSSATAAAAPRFWRHRLPAFLLAAALAVAWGSVVQTQFNLAQLQALGAEVSMSLRLLTTAQDLAGFAPLYAVVVVAGLGSGFVLAALVCARVPAWRAPLFALAGGSSLIVAVRCVDALTPPPVLIAATRGSAGLLAMAFGGVLAGLLYARLTRRRRFA